MDFFYKCDKCGTVVEWTVRGDLLAATQPDDIGCIVFECDGRMSPRLEGYLAEPDDEWSPDRDETDLNLE